MTLSYFTEVSLLSDIIPQHPDAIVLSSHSFYNYHKQKHHITALLISICVIQTHSVVVLTYCDQTVDSFWNYAVYNLHRQANLHCTLHTRLHVSLTSLSAAAYTPSVCPTN
jgi:hypothetical protein